MRQKLLVSVRGKNEALEAIEGGALIADVEYPSSALGTPYPLNIMTVREALNECGYDDVSVSTNIGEKQNERPNACQAALGVATAGCDIIKFGLAELPLDAAVYLGKQIVRTVKQWYPEKILIPAVFIDKDMQRSFNVFDDSSTLADAINADGVLIDTYNKYMGKGLLDYCSVSDIKGFVRKMHATNKEAWIAGSIAKEELSPLWDTGIDVICIRAAACESIAGKGRFGEVKREIVMDLISTMP